MCNTYCACVPLRVPVPVRHKTVPCRSPSYYSPGMYPPPPPMSRPVALVRSSEAATTSPPISTGSPGDQHQLRYDLMPPILPPGEHGHAEGGQIVILDLYLSPWVREFFPAGSSSFMDQFFVKPAAQSIALMNCYDGSSQLSL